MDPVIYFLAEHYPWWGIPCVFIFFETANHFRRTGRRAPMMLFGFLAISLAALAVLYFTHDGFFRLRPAMQNLERQYKQ